MDINIKKDLLEAIEKLYQNDYSLIDRGCSERSIVFRLGIYLHEKIKCTKYDIDCEFNRSGHIPKYFMDKKICYPDIIIHERGNDSNNMLVIEVKTANCKTKNLYINDKCKLEKFTDKAEGKYKYKIGLHVFISANICNIAWYSYGRLLRIYSYRFEDNVLKMDKKIDAKQLQEFELYYKAFRK